MKKKLTIFLTASILLAAVGMETACTKGGTLTTITGSRYTITAAASAKQLVPAIDTSSTGSLTGLYDEDANIFTYTLSWNDLWKDSRKDTITSISFYGPANAGANGQLVRTLPFVNPNKAGSINLGLSGNNGLKGNEINDFLAGTYYFTVNTKRYGTGIIRGQLSVQKQ
ncbi:CHRD domain-containing protein [Filimonas effusa]|uniref:CHRD domain-containing protein n=1 Tax=Filimonas effusa TaxID=2508721 RepID=A0A4Q1D7D9_9BACT|nr:CHRD domain-containing protein [Filimonas effusa]RXK83661.1 CHRD domain-containing protein [Filimonas effusa]